LFEGEDCIRGRDGGERATLVWVNEGESGGERIEAVGNEFLEDFGDRLEEGDDSERRG
jgi:hypothetical protein